MPYDNDGNIHGIRKEWSEKGQLLSEREYKYGIPVNNHQWRHPNGKLKEQAFYDTNGKLHGIVEAWFDNGQCGQRREWAHGKRTGTHEYWDKNGQLIFHGIYGHHGRFVGKTQSWNEDGELIREIHYSSNGEVIPSKVKCRHFAMRLSEFCDRDFRVGLAPEDGWDVTYLIGGNGEYTLEQIHFGIGKPSRIWNKKEWEKQRWEYKCKDGVVQFQVTNFNDIPGRDAVIVNSGPVNVRYR